MKPTFKKINDELFSNSALKLEKLSVIRGGKNCKAITVHGDHTHTDTISNDDDYVVTPPKDGGVIKA